MIHDCSTLEKAGLVLTEDPKPLKKADHLLATDLSLNKGKQRVLKGAAVILTALGMLLAKDASADGGGISSQTLLMNPTFRGLLAGVRIEARPVCGALLIDDNLQRKVADPLELAVDGTASNEQGLLILKIADAEDPLTHADLVVGQGGENLRGKFLGFAQSRFDQAEKNFGVIEMRPDRRLVVSLHRAVSDASGSARATAFVGSLEIGPQPCP